MPHGTKPHPERLARVLKNRARRHRRLMATARTDPASPRGRPTPGGLTTRTNKALRPPQMHEILPASVLAAEPVLKLQHRPGIILHSRILQVGVGGVN